MNQPLIVLLVLIMILTIMFQLTGQITLTSKKSVKTAFVIQRYRRCLSGIAKNRENFPHAALQSRHSVP